MEAKDRVKIITDWIKDYVESMWLMLQAKKPSDFVISTGKSHSVKNFVEEAFKYINIKIAWRGKGLKEVGYDKKTRFTKSLFKCKKPCSKGKSKAGNNKVSPICC